MFYLQGEKVCTLLHIKIYKTKLENIKVLNCVQTRLR